MSFISKRVLALALLVPMSALARGTVNGQPASLACYGSPRTAFRGHPGGLRQDERLSLHVLSHVACGTHQTDQSHPNRGSIVSEIEIRDIPGHDRYGASADGRIWSRRRSDEWRQKSASLDTMGYPKVGLGHGGIATVHKLIALTFIGPRPSGMDINHIDGDKENPAAANLEYCTRSDNQSHAYRIGLRALPERKPSSTPKRVDSNHAPAIGERNAACKVNECIVREIRSLHAQGVRSATIARNYALSSTQIFRIVNRIYWTHVA